MDFWRRILGAAVKNMYTVITQNLNRNHEMYNSRNESQRNDGHLPAKSFAFIIHSTAFGKLNDGNGL